MTIKNRLRMNALVVFISMAVIVGAAVVGLTYIQNNVSVLTQKTTPYQLRALQQQRALQAHASNLVTLSASDSGEQLKKRNSETEQSLKQVVQAYDDFAKLKGDLTSDRKAIEDITKSVLTVVEKKVQNDELGHKGVEEVRKKLDQASKHVNLADESIRKLQQRTSAEVVSGISRLIGVNEQANSLITAMDGLKDLQLLIGKIPITTDKRSLEVAREDVSRTVGKIIKALRTVNPIEGLDPTTDDLVRRLNEVSDRVGGSRGIAALQIQSETDSKIKEQIESITKSLLKEIISMVPTVEKELQGGQKNVKSNTDSMEKNTESFKETNSILALASVLPALNTSIILAIQDLHSEEYVVGRVEHFNRQLAEIKDLFNRGEMTSKKLKELLLKGGYKEEVKLVDSFSGIFLSVKNECLKQNGLFDIFRRVLGDIAELRDLNTKMGSIADKQLAESGKEVAKAGQSQENSIIALNRAGKLTKYSVAIIGIAAIVFSLLLSRWIGKTITEPVKELNAVAEGFGSGDFTVRMNDKRKDEFGVLAGHFNQASEQLRKVTQQITTAIKQLSENSASLESVSGALSGSTKEQSSQTEQTATAIVEMSQTFVDVARNASDAAGSSKQTADLARNGKAAVQETVRGMSNIANAVKNAGETVGSLGASSQEIDKVVHVINEIAEQINLLALNAAIEAARAGEHGRGFAVVADEVRKLAEKTVGSTEEIGGIIEKIQADVKKSVLAIQQGKEEVAQGEKLALTAGNSLDMIVSASDSGADMIQRIASATEEQSVTAGEVTKSVEQIAIITRNLGTSVDAIRKAAENLDHQSKELTTTASWFKI